MSLRIRLILSIILVLILSLCAGGGVAFWHAVRSVRTEMQAALDVGAKTLRNGLAEAPAGTQEAEPARLVRIFDGDRHIRAVLRLAGQDQLSSVLHTAKPRVPGWFVALLSPALAPVRFDISPPGPATGPGSGLAIILEPDPRNEAGEVWTQLKDELIAIGLFCGLSILLVSFVLRHALRPLERISAALAALGAGDCSVRIPPDGPPELLRLARGVNTMAEQLQAAQSRNLRLTEQILTLQEEERADLARDLHDEIGPFLFAVNLDAAAIEQAVTAAATGHRPDKVAERARAIREAVSHMQRHVRAMLHRLRPANPVEAGLATALGNLIAFWRARRPAIDFLLAISGPPDALDDQTLSVVYRLVQESLNNAVRHGDPTRIEVAVLVGSPNGSRTANALVRIADDGVGLASTAPGLGLTGMRERVAALGGTIHIGAGDRGKGLTVTATLPCAMILEDA